MQTTQLICPLCMDTVDRMVYRFHYDSERQVLAKIKELNPGWAEQDGICSRCVDYYHSEIVREQRILPEIGPHFSIRTADDFMVIPTGLRLDADPRYTGKGVTICFIDSGFFAHPDLVATRNRIKVMIDFTQPTYSGCTGETREEAWHGTMTTVVCAGDGHAGKGLYKGIASDAELVLLKVQDANGRISSQIICRALQWVLENHRAYNIRIINMSLGDEEAISYKESNISLLAEQLISEGVTIVAAVGNDENGTIKPPANSLHVIAVGGTDDNNRLDNENTHAYHSAFGQTVDHLQKPELVAPAVWIAAPILPGTKEEAEAGVVHYLLTLQDTSIIPELHRLFRLTQLEEAVLQSNDVPFIRETIIRRIRAAKYISPNYMHVDGTSFAAPIVTALVAQLLEVNPLLTPADIREILFSTARRVEGIEAARQGFGAVQPRKALLKILKRGPVTKPYPSPYINKEKNTIEFYIRHECASQISLAGSFNHWTQDVLLFEPGVNGIWKIEIPMLPAGRYQYKFFIDERHWKEDADNPYREPDGFSGFNSLLFISN